ncbi:ATP-grasp domain-containing protein [Pseudalkalibacillus hwajinpoensis]|uniref:ATP-grasp domain-containing protein n=1 Tax=Guptibacillus hwajinpoensis TaxID=208199 RepID=UPI00146B7D9F|nr:ATP-grasp domain-containing protein [Pseudalkalibacillus hwajinpoensis]
MIIKPIDQSGSRTVHLCSDANDMYLFIKNNYEVDGWIVEEYLEGNEYSVETITINRKHYFVGITEKIKTSPPRFVELGHVFPADISINLYDNIKKIVKRFLDGAKYEFGPCHTEVIVTKDGVKIVESQARFGGDQINKLIEISTEEDAEELIFKVLSQKMKIEQNEIPKFHKKNISKIKYISYKEGEEVERLNEINTIYDLPFVHSMSLEVDEGRLAPYIVDSKSRHGYIIFSAKNHNELIDYERQINTILNKTNFS